MTNQNNNPFVLPGLGQSGELGQNPLLASMEMMRQAWQGMAGSGSLAQSSLATPMSLEDLERRIADLHTVENWLRMNLSMLSSTIQGLEVQRATIATIKSFIATPAADSGSEAGASPLEIVLGLKPSGQAKIRPAAKPAATSESSGADAPTPDALATTAGWWNMLQKQFDTLASATAATMQGAEALQAAATEAAVPKKPSPVAPSAKTAVKSSASKATAKTAAKAAPRKRAASASKKTRP